MRPGEDMPRPRPRDRPRRVGSRRLRVILALVLVGFIVALLSLRSLAGLYTDYLWFDSLGFASVWREVLLAKTVLALVFIAIMFALLWVNLYLADRFAPTYRAAGPEEEFLRRYHELVGHRTGMVRLGVAGLFAFTWGITAGTQWREWILLQNRQDFGITDPQFGKDYGFYVFELPFLQFVIEWMFTAILFVLVVTVAAHYLNGGIRVNATKDRVTAQVKVHVSILLAALALVQALDYWYQRYTLTLSDRGIVDGATYTDVNAQLPALKLLMLISLCAAALLLINVRRRGWVLPAVAVGLWAFVALVMGGIYPWVYQRLVVEPSESTKESPFIERNIEATRYGYNTVEISDDESGGNVDSIPFAVSQELTPELLQANVKTLENVLLLDPDIVEETYEEQQADRQEYRFADLDVDRYVIDGETRPVVIGARQLDYSNLPRKGWENTHLSFTHGYGVALAPGNTTNEGSPDFVVSELPTAVDRDRIDLVIDQPQIYIAEGVGGYAIVGTERAEVDYPGPDDQNVLTTYEGADGVPIGGFLRRTAFALRFGDINPLFSGFLNSDSRVIFNRDVRTRAAELAPFLAYDADPYPIILEGRVQWVLDAYTTTGRLPYSQRANRESVPRGSGLRAPFNYVRNSVKVLVDGYDGTVTFYVVDPKDPIVSAYRKAFPELFTDGDEMPDELLAHLRYPEDLFRVQTNMWGSYHIGTAADFFDPSQAWSVARAPLKNVNSGEVEAATPTPTAVSVEEIADRDLIDPLYLQMRLPGEDDQEFVLYRPFVAADATGGRQELLAFMVARSDPDNYGQMSVYEIPGARVDGPALADNKMRSDPIVSRQVSLLGQVSSSVTLGNMVLAPVGDALVWIRPLYVSGDLFPQFTSAIVSHGNDVRICPTLSLALSALFVDEDRLDGDQRCNGVESVFADAEGAVSEPDGGPDPTPTPDAQPTPAPPVGTLPEEVEQLLRDADMAFADAQEALAEGDLGRYQELVDEAQAMVAEAIALLQPADDT